MENMQDGFAIFDADQRLEYCNSQYFHDYPDIASKFHPGISYPEIMRAIYPLTDGNFGGMKLDLETYVELRTQYFEESRSYDIQLPDDRWIGVKDHKLADGRHVRYRSDISAQKKLELALAKNEAQLSEAQRSASRVSAVGHGMHKRRLLLGLMNITASLALRPWASHLKFLLAACIPMIGMRSSKILKAFASPAD